MKKTEKLEVPEVHKISIFKRGLPKYTKRYIKQEKPDSLLENLKKTKEAEELGSDYDGHEDIKGYRMLSLSYYQSLTPRSNLLYQLFLIRTSLNVSIAAVSNISCHIVSTIQVQYQQPHPVRTSRRKAKQLALHTNRMRYVATVAARHTL